MTEKLMAFAHLGTSISVAGQTATQRIDYSITGSAATPLPTDLRPTSVFECGTGQLALAPALGDVVRTAGRYVQSAAVLPATAEGNALVDQLLRAKTKGLSGRRLLERRDK